MATHCAYIARSTESPVIFAVLVVLLETVSTYVTVLVRLDFDTFSLDNYELPRTFAGAIAQLVLSCAAFLLYVFFVCPYTDRDQPTPFIVIPYAALLISKTIDGIANQPCNEAHGHNGSHPHSHGRCDESDFTFFIPLIINMIGYANLWLGWYSIAHHVHGNANPEAWLAYPFLSFSWVAHVVLMVFILFPVIFGGLQGAYGPEDNWLITLGTILEEAMLMHLLEIIMHAYHDVSKALREREQAPEVVPQERQAAPQELEEERHPREAAEPQQRDAALLQQLKAKLQQREAALQLQQLVAERQQREAALQPLEAALQQLEAASRQLEAARQQLAAEHQRPEEASVAAEPAEAEAEPQRAAEATRQKHEFTLYYCLIVKYVTTSVCIILKISDFSLTHFELTAVLVGAVIQIVVNVLIYICLSVIACGSNFHEAPPITFGCAFIFLLIVEIIYMIEIADLKWILQIFIDFSGYAVDWTGWSVLQKNLAERCHQLQDQEEEHSKYQRRATFLLACCMTFHLVTQTCIMGVFIIGELAHAYADELGWRRLIALLEEILLFGIAEIIWEVAKEHFSSPHRGCEVMREEIRPQE